MVANEVRNICVGLHGVAVEIKLIVFNFSGMSQSLLTETVSLRVYCVRESIIFMGHKSLLKIYAVSRFEGYRNCNMCYYWEFPYRGNSVLHSLEWNWFMEDNKCMSGGQQLYVERMLICISCYFQGFSNKLFALKKHLINTCVIVLLYQLYLRFHTHNKVILRKKSYIDHTYGHSKASLYTMFDV